MSERPGKETLVSVGELLAYLREQKRFSQHELALLEEACLFAERHYTHLTHPTGNPYLSYACGVARMLATLEAEAPTIAASLLCPPPLVERTTVDELKSHFQNDPALLDLVDELLYLSHLEWDIWTTQQSESHACRE